VVGLCSFQSRRAKASLSLHLTSTGPCASLCREPRDRKSEKCCGDLITIVDKTISVVAVEVIDNVWFAVTENIDFSMEFDDKRPSFIGGTARLRCGPESTTKSRAVRSFDRAYLAFYHVEKPITESEPGSAA
jgi:hypothetical protein